jgi:hypothetical protein
MTPSTHLRRYGISSKLGGAETGEKCWLRSSLAAKHLVNLAQDAMK